MLCPYVHSQQERNSFLTRHRWKRNPPLVNVLSGRLRELPTDGVVSSSPSPSPYISARGTGWCCHIWMRPAPLACDAGWSPPGTLLRMIPSQDSDDLTVCGRTWGPGKQLLIKLSSIFLTPLPANQSPSTLSDQKRGSVMGSVWSIGRGAMESQGLLHSERARVCTMGGTGFL